MDDILSFLLEYKFLIGIFIIFIIISYPVYRIIRASNSNDVWKPRFFLEAVGIIVAIAAFGLTVVEIRESTDARKAETEVRKDEAIDRNWDVVYTREATSIRRTKALQNLARLGESFEGIDLSPKAIGIEKGVNLRKAKLINVNLFGANLTSADLRWANLTSADLRWANLTSADLGGADLTSAFLGGADLTSADLTKTNLTAANLFLTDFSDATISEDTVLDYTWVWEGPGKEKTRFLPIGIPKDWDTTLKPKYICPRDFDISAHINVSEYSSEEEEQEELKNALRQIMKENCRPYTNALE